MAWTFYNSDGQRLVKQSSSGGGGDVSFGGNTFGETKVIGSNDNYNFGLETNGCTRLTVQNDGKVGIGETSPHAILHVKDGDSSICAPTNAIAHFERSGTAETYIQLSGQSDATGGIWWGRTGGGNNAMQILMHHDQLDFRFGGSLRERFASGGAVYFYDLGTGSANDIHISGDQIIENVSSRRYKKDERDFSLDSKLLQQLVIKDFTWKEDTGTPNKTDFGLIAEDTYDVCPALVSMTEIDGEIVPDSVPTRPLLMLAVAEVQRLHRENEALKGRVATLESS